MSGGANNPLSKVVGRIFPKVPDFVGMIAEQSALAVDATSALVSFMESGSEEAALRVRELEHRGDSIKDRNVDELNQAFSTPMDREDLYRAMISIDEILNYCKTTVREMEVLGVAPDAHTLEMAHHLKDGAEALNQGYQTFSTAPAGAEGFAQAAKKAERNTEKTYRRALAELFDVEQHVAEMESMEGHSGPEALRKVMDVFKKREVYRHMSNAADKLAGAGGCLHDIVVKTI
ncbi:MAG: DUF47 family protein [Candidatus Phosphoribacter baldrii]|jgi:predicted phosphate transport protein (TIGR00153 family)|nr:DUF47 family protein [Candidatus Phosphoribacter baldrii]